MGNPSDIPASGPGAADDFQTIDMNNRDEVLRWSEWLGVSIDGLRQAASAAGTGVGAIRAHLAGNIPAQREATRRAEAADGTGAPPAAGHPTEVEPRVSATNAVLGRPDLEHSMYGMLIEPEEQDGPSRHEREIRGISPDAGHAADAE